MYKLIPVALALTALVAQPVGAAKKDSESTKVQSLGQAAIYGTDVAMARDKALEDAMRKAVEQAVGAMVSSETVTENFELISDKIFSKSRGYVRKYKVLSEGKEEGAGIYQVKIEAVVASGNLNNDLQGVLAVLKAKNMPRVLIMVAEQNIGQANGGMVFTQLNAVENAFMDSWTPKGFKFVDRQALQGKLSTGPAVSNDANAAQVKELSDMTGAELVVIGQAVANDVGPIMGTQMHSVRANISVRAINPDNGNVVASSIQTQAVGHIDPTTGGTQALAKVAQKAADDLLKKVMAVWESEVAGPSQVKLTVKNVSKSRFLRAFSEVLRNQVRGVADVRQRSYKSKVAELEVDIKGSAQDLAEELEDKKFPGFAVEIDEVTANTVVAVLK